MSAETVEATWMGPYTATLEGGRRLTPGVDTAQIGRDEAEASDYWQPVQPAPSPATSTAAPAITEE